MEGGFTKHLLLLAVLILGVQVLGNSCGAAAPGGAENKMTLGSAMLQGFAEEAESLLYNQYMPYLVFAVQGSRVSDWLFWEQVDCLFPVYGYLRGEAGEKEQARGPDMRTIMLAEAEEGSTDVSEEGTAPDAMSSERDVEGETLAELLRTENEAALQQQQQIQQMQVSDFVPHQKQSQVDLEALRDYETLVRQFYTIDGNTTAGRGDLDIDKFLGADMTVKKEGDGPQILIYHTHSQEGFADSEPGEEAHTIMGVGDYLTELLTEVYGYRVLHHRGKYDVESRDDAYSNSLGDIERVLEENPSIEVVIDLHRDAVPEETRLVTDLDGRPTARFMFFNGLSRTKNTGNIAYLYNENLESNLAFSFQMQLKAAEYYPGLTRRIYLKGYRYNMHLRPKYLLIEMGAQNNTLEEVMNACDPLAHILDLVLSGEQS